MIRFVNMLKERQGTVSMDQPAHFRLTIAEVPKKQEDIETIVVMRSWNRVCLKPQLPCASSPAFLTAQKLIGSKANLKSANPELKLVRPSADPLVQTIILGLIQGLTEWLPISSTAHLRIAEHFLNYTATPLFNVTLHAGTLVAVMFYFRKELVNMLSALASRDFRSEYGRWIPLILAAMVPTAIIGLVYVTFLEEPLQTIPMIGVTLVIGASIVYASKSGEESVRFMTFPMAIGAGFAQGFAVFPGLSRSGVVISSLLMLGLNKEKAFKFSFLLSIPAILGDLVVEAYVQRGQFLTQGVDSLHVLVGLVLAMVTGYFAIRIVARLVTTKRFFYFAFYTWSLGVALILLSLAGF